MTKRLTWEQTRVVRHDAGHALIKAVPGSGKTTTLVKRVERLIKTGVEPGSILILMYNKSATVSFSDKLKLALKSDAIPEVRTFHSLALKIVALAERQQLTPKKMLITPGNYRYDELVKQAYRVGCGAMASGDRFEIRPTSGAAAGIKVVMTDPKGIAAAAPKITQDAANSGNTQVKLVSIDNRSVANFPLTGSELTFEIDTTANTFEVFDAAGNSLGAPTAFTPPSISAYGFTFEVDASAPATDRFTFDLSFAEGDIAVCLDSLRLPAPHHSAAGQASAYRQPAAELAGETGSGNHRRLGDPRHLAWGLHRLPAVGADRLPAAE